MWLPHFTLLHLTWEFALSSVNFLKFYLGLCTFLRQLPYISPGSLDSPLSASFHLTWICVFSSFHTYTPYLDLCIFITLHLYILPGYVFSSHFTPLHLTWICVYFPHFIPLYLSWTCVFSSLLNFLTSNLDLCTLSLYILPGSEYFSYFTSLLFSWICVLSQLSYTWVFVLSPNNFLTS